MKVKKSFVLYHDFRNWFSLLTDEELGRLIRAIFDYEMNKELPENLNEKEQIAFLWSGIYLTGTEKNTRESATVTRKMPVSDGRK